MPLFATVEREDAERFRAVFLVSLLDGPAAADLPRERGGIVGSNHIGGIVRKLRADGMIVVASFTTATAPKAHGRLTRTWQLTEAGRVEAERLAAQRAPAQEVA